VRVVTFDQPGNKGVSGDSYNVVPWFVSTRGYGFHLDSSAESLFDMRKTQQDRFVVRNLFNTLAFNVVYGPRLTDVLSRFTGYAGRPALLPPFTFGSWISSDAWRSGGEVRYAVTKFRERGIPASMFVFDSPWETAYNDFTFNMTQFGKGGTFEGERLRIFIGDQADPTVLDRIVADLRYAVRVLVRSPGFTLTAIAVLARLKATCSNFGRYFVRHKD